MKKKTKKVRSGRNFKVLLILGIPLALIIFSFITLKQGDRLFAKDDLADAEVLYSMSKVTNPFNSEIDRRLWAIKVIDQEKIAYNRELIVQKKQKESDQKVLGASITVPVLMYHYIRINPDIHDTVGYGLSVTPYNFDAQMKYLEESGYHSVTVDQLRNALLNNSPLPTKPIVITFDDGYADAYYNAFPVLRKYGLRATEFVTTTFVGLPRYLDWHQIEEMSASGVFSIESHSIHHYALTYVNSQSLKYELEESKKELEGHIKRRVDWIAYPYGNYDKRVEDLVKESGYVGAFSTVLGNQQSTTNLYALPRIRIGGGDSVESFAAKLPWK